MLFQVQHNGRADLARPIRGYTKVTDVRAVSGVLEPGVSEFHLVRLDCAENVEKLLVRHVHVSSPVESHLDVFELPVLPQQSQGIEEVSVVEKAALLDVRAWRCRGRTVIEVDLDRPNEADVDEADHLEESSHVFVAHFFPTGVIKVAARIVLTLKTELVLSVQHRTAFFMDTLTGTEKGS